MRVLFLIPKAKAPRLDESEGWSKEFVDFLAKCLQKDPQDVSIQVVPRSCELTDSDRQREICSNTPSSAMPDLLHA